MRDTVTSAWLSFLLYASVASGPAPPDTVKCDQLNSNMDMSTMSSCEGPSIKINTGLLNISHATQLELNLLFTDNETQIVRNLHHSLNLIDSKIQNLFFTAYPDNNDITYLIKNNDYLKSIMLDRRAAKKYPVFLELQGNKHLSQENIKQFVDKLENVKEGSYIQDEGECTLQNRKTLYLKTMKDLEECQYFYKDLVINEYTELAPDIAAEKLKLKFVKDGCIYITGSQLKDLNFLNSLQNGTNCTTLSEISGNPKLCLSSELMHNITLKLGKVIFGNNMETNCEDVCTAMWALDSRDTGVKCYKIYGELQIIGETDDSNMDFLSNLHEIEGSLEIANNTFENLRFLPKLWKITPAASVSAIRIHHNERLRNIELPSMKKVESPSESEWLVVHDNHESQYFTIAEAEEFRKIGTINAVVEKITTTEEPVERTTSGKGSEGGSQDGKGKENQKGNAKSKEEEGLHVGISAGIAIGVAVATIIACFFAFVVVLMVLGKRKRQRKAEVQKENALQEAENELLEKALEEKERLEEEKKAEEEQKKADEEQKKAEEEQKKADEEKKKAVEEKDKNKNSTGEKEETREVKKARHEERKADNVNRRGKNAINKAINETKRDRKIKKQGMQEAAKKRREERMAKPKLNDEDNKDNNKNNNNIINNNKKQKDGIDEKVNRELMIKAWSKLEDLPKPTTKVTRFALSMHLKSEKKKRLKRVCKEILRMTPWKFLMRNRKRYYTMYLWNKRDPKKKTKNIMFDDVYNYVFAKFTNWITDRGFYLKEYEDDPEWWYPIPNIEADGLEPCDSVLDKIGFINHQDIFISRRGKKHVVFFWSSSDLRSHFEIMDSFHKLKRNVGQKYPKFLVVENRNQERRHTWEFVERRRHTDVDFSSFKYVLNNGIPGRDMRDMHNGVLLNAPLWPLKAMPRDTKHLLRFVKHVILFNQEYSMLIFEEDDNEGHENTLKITNMIFGRIMDMKERYLSFRMACRFITYRIDKPWVGDFLLLHLQMNLLKWAKTVGALRNLRKRYKRWRKAYRFFQRYSCNDVDLMYFDPERLGMKRRHKKRRKRRKSKKPSKRGKKCYAIKMPKTLRRRSYAHPPLKTGRLPKGNVIFGGIYSQRIGQAEGRDPLDPQQEDEGAEERREEEEKKKREEMKKQGANNEKQKPEGIPVKVHIPGWTDSEESKEEENEEEKEGDKGKKGLTDQQLMECRVDETVDPRPTKTAKRVFPKKGHEAFKKHYYPDDRDFFRKKRHRLFFAKKTKKLQNTVKGKVKRKAK